MTAEILSKNKASKFSEKKKQKRKVLMFDSM